MQVSEEDIEQAMEVLGMEALDLLQPQNLIELVQNRVREQFGVELECEVRIVK